MKLERFCRAVHQSVSAARPLVLSLFTVLNPCASWKVVVPQSSDSSSTARSRHHVGGNKDALAAASHSDQHPGLVVGEAGCARVSLLIPQ